MRSRLDRLCRTAGAVLIGVIAGAGCGSSPPQNTTSGSGNTISCLASVADYCAQDSCIATWADAQAAASACPINVLPYTTLSCGAYLGLSQFFGDGNTTAYYDRSSGQLVAVGTFSANNGMTYCEAGPAGGFAFPACDAPDAGAAPDCGRPDAAVM